MNRKILFRGKRIDTGSWVKGFYCKDEFGKDRIWVQHDNNSLNWFEVRPETVGQFIGLLDKNEKEIFEGDILSSQNDRDCVIEFCNDEDVIASCGGCCTDSFSGSGFVGRIMSSRIDRYPSFATDLSDKTIIGNVFDDNDHEVLMNIFMDRCESVVGLTPIAIIKSGSKMRLELKDFEEASSIFFEGTKLDILKMIDEWESSHAGDYYDEM